MSKLRLSLEALEVQSFVTAAKQGERGTVHGASVDPPETFEAGCSGDQACTGTCTGASAPDMICNTNAQEVCPEYSGLGCV